jgi:hypothetical protein
MFKTTMFNDEVIVVAKIISKAEFGSGIGYVVVETSEYNAESFDSSHFKDMDKDAESKLPVIYDDREGRGS